MLLADSSAMFSRGERKLACLSNFRYPVKVVKYTREMAAACAAAVEDVVEDNVEPVADAASAVVDGVVAVVAEADVAAATEKTSHKEK